MPLEPKRIPEPRISEQLWTTSDDTLLKSLVESYHNNWSLIADALNTSRLSVSTDRRNSWDCFYRWTLPPAVKTDGESPVPSVTNLSNRPKRHAAMSASEAAAVASANTNPEARKRRRHIVMQDAIRKVAKKRDQLAKAAGEHAALAHEFKSDYHSVNSKSEETGSCS
jgi:chromatin modification-related protein VID21